MWIISAQLFATKLNIFSIDINSDYCNEMYIPSITTVAACVFLVYMCHSTWIMTRLFTTLQCTSTPCYKSFLGIKPKLQLALFTAVGSNPISSEAFKIYSNKNFDYWQEFERDFVLDIPPKTRRNGTLHMQVVLAMQGEPLEWKTLKRDGPTVIQTLVLTEFMLPKEQTFSLLGADEDSRPQNKHYLPSFNSDLPLKPVSHIMSQVHIVLLTDEISLSHEDVPPEMAHLIRVNKNQQILPILRADYFNSRIKNLVRITENTTELTITFHYKPIGIGKLRLMLMVEHAMKMFLTMGFSTRDADEVKGIFSDTNVYLLCGTLLIGSVHILFDFLAFKNDVTFWRKKKSYEGLSTRTVLWRTFSQVVIFIYLLEENTSMLVIIPAGLGTLIEIWKCKKILKLNFSLRGLTKKVTSIGWAENKTEEFDKQGMKYLSYFLYPVCIAGAIYSLIYQPHKSWYSWTLNSLVNGIYAFGFLLMLPQLFVNYKLKSVAALPWRAFMYKAFNTFIDDLFAFIITMPTAHRVACLRDDVVFIIYLYQRWLYPVDNKRLDTDLAYEENKDKKEL